MNEYRPSVAGQLERVLARFLSPDSPQDAEAPPVVAAAPDEHCGSQPAALPRHLDCDPLDALPATPEPPHADPPPAAPGIAGATQPSEPTPPAAYDQEVFERVARAYAAARMEHLLNDDGPNRAAYLAIADDAAAARDVRAAEFASAARVFATAGRP